MSEVREVPTSPPSEYEPPLAVLLDDSPPRETDTRRGAGDRHGDSLGLTRSPGFV